MKPLKIQYIYQDRHHLREGEFVEIEDFNTLQNDAPLGWKKDDSFWLVPDSVEEWVRGHHYNDNVSVSASSSSRVGYFEVDDVLYLQIVDSASGEITGGARFLDAEKFQGSFNGSEIEQVFPKNSQGAQAAALEIDNKIMLSAARQQVGFISIQPTTPQEDDLIDRAVEIMGSNKGDIFCADVETVKDLQRGISAAGYDLGPNSESGTIDSYTQQAIVNFTIEFGDEISQYRSTEQPQRQR